MEAVTTEPQRSTASEKPPPPREHGEERERECAGLIHQPLLLHSLMPLGDFFFFFLPNEGVRGPPQRSSRGPQQASEQSRRLPRESHQHSTQREDMASWRLVGTGLRLDTSLLIPRHWSVLHEPPHFQLQMTSPSETEMNCTEYQRLSFGCSSQM